MKTFRLLSITIFSTLLSFSFIQAQHNDALAGTLVKADRYNTSTTKSNQPDFSAGKHLASFKDLGLYISEHLVYPELAQKYSIEGTVSVQVVINSDGTVRKARITRSLGYGCDEAALKLVQDMPRWQPAKNYGIAVESKQILDFKFRLQ